MPTVGHHTAQTLSPPPGWGDHLHNRTLGAVRDERFVALLGTIQSERLALRRFEWFGSHELPRGVK